MITIAGIELLNNSSIVAELRKIFGIGYEKSSYICDILGIGKSFKIKFCNKFLEGIINFLVPANYDVNLRLDTVLKQDYLNKLVINLKKAERLARGLTARGQGTHSNHNQNRLYLIHKWQEKKEQIYFMRKRLELN